ncbi:MAG: transporter [Xanthomonadales bacterium]|jgi:hypothetical protein|nr:transporter [Xanthomonadales bacterium]
MTPLYKQPARLLSLLWATCLLALGIAPLQAQESDADLAQDLTNPVADLVTLPVQLNYDRGIGPLDDGEKWQVNVQPVVPFEISEDWNLITRTIMPVIWQDDVFPGTGSQFGLGDINLTLFLSPKQPTAGGLTWGVGPVFVLPTATDSKLGGKKWGAGPAAIALKMQGAWTYGVLANHVWSYAGSDNRPDINNTFMQPFVAYTWPSAWTLSVQSETSYNWESENWTVPVNVAFAKLKMFGKLPVSLQAGVGYWFESPAGAADDWRLRFQANFVLPR